MDLVKESLKFSDDFLSELLDGFWVGCIFEFLFPVLRVEFAARFVTILFVFWEESESKGFTEVGMNGLIELIGFIDEVLSVECKFLKVEGIWAEDSLEMDCNHALLDYFGSRIVNNDGSSKAQNDFKVLVSAECWYEDDKRVDTVHKAGDWEEFTFDMVYDLVDKKAGFYDEGDNDHNAREKHD